MSTVNQNVYLLSITVNHTVCVFLLLPPDGAASGSVTSRLAEAEALEAEHVAEVDRLSRQLRGLTVSFGAYREESKRLIGKQMYVGISTDSA